MIHVITSNRRPVVLLCLAPLDNVQEALRLEPGIAERAHIVGLHGCVQERPAGPDYTISRQVDHNVAGNVEAFRDVFRAAWLSKTIAPLDTSASLWLPVARLRESPALPLFWPAAA